MRPKERAVAVVGARLDAGLRREPLLGPIGDRDPTSLRRGPRLGDQGRGRLVEPPPRIDLPGEALLVLPAGWRWGRDDSRVGWVAYPYEDLDDSQFERLVVQCSRPLFGPAVQSFAAGPDGGRDARFEGTAANFPSTTRPWAGITVIQAKHTNATNAHFSDSDFSSDVATSTLTQELVRIKRLVDAKDLDNYLLFSNRRLGAIASGQIVSRIALETGLDRANIFLAGVEYLGTLLHEQPGLSHGLK